MVLVNWKSIDRLKFKELYPELLAYYKDGIIPKKSKSALSKFINHTKMFEYDSTKKEGRIYLVADNLPDDSLKGIVSLPITLELVNPSDENIQNIVSTVYSHSLVGGFRGTEPLYKKIKQSYLGITRQDVADVLKKMELKQYQRIPALKKLQTIITSRPMEQIQIDLIEVADWAYFNDKTEFLMTVKDMFSKFAWCIPLKNKSCAVVAERLQHLFLVEGFPEILQSDNGGEFIGEEMVELSKRYDMEVRHSLPYHSSTQGSIEKFNSTVRNMIHQYQVDWKTKRYIDQLPFLMYSYNTTVHSTNKFTPFQVFRKKDEKFKLDDIVFQNIKRNAKKMIKKNLKTQKLVLQPLKLGDKVRVDMKSTHAIRSMSDITKESTKKKRLWFNFTKDVYTVIDVINKKDEDGELSVTKYRIDFESDRTFFREELLKVKVDELIELSHKTSEKEDLNFGVKFNPEDHLAKLHGKVAIEDNKLGEEGLEWKIEDEEEERVEEEHEEDLRGMDYKHNDDELPKKKVIPSLKVLPKRDKKKKLSDEYVWG